MPYSINTPVITMPVDYKKKNLIGQILLFIRAICIPFVGGLIPLFWNISTNEGRSGRTKWAVRGPVKFFIDIDKTNLISQLPNEKPCLIRSGRLILCLSAGFIIQRRSNRVHIQKIKQKSNDVWWYYTVWHSIKSTWR